uniref:SFRICE_038003 n=1 Tax=Spodoptera frugiperda TaxID=7108 RepID=A0A2H1WE23_SPOFR
MMLVSVVVTALLVLRGIEGTPCTRVRSVDITNGVKHPNSSVTYEGVEYKVGTWYELEENGTTLVLGCPCIGRICIHRCCSQGSAYYNWSCTETNSSAINPFSPPVYNGKVKSSVVAHEQFFYLYSRPCSDSYAVDSGTPGEELYIQEVR